jgi:hypothetical protein
VAASDAGAVEDLLEQVVERGPHAKPVAVAALGSCGSFDVERQNRSMDRFTEHRGALPRAT